MHQLATTGKQLSAAAFWDMPTGFDGQKGLNMTSKSVTAVWKDSCSPSYRWVDLTGISKSGKPLAKRQINCNLTGYTVSVLTNGVLPLFTGSIWATKPPVLALRELKLMWKGKCVATNHVARRLPEFSVWRADGLEEKWPSDTEARRARQDRTKNTNGEKDRKQCVNFPCRW